MVPDLPSDGALRQLFVVPPFSILDAQQGPWQERKRQWMALGMRSEEGRGAGLVFRHKLIDDLPGTSRFDPVLAECVYRWYAPRPGSAPVIVVDPFAGGSVRGIVAAKLGLQYIGVDISATQVDANRAARAWWTTEARGSTDACPTNSSCSRKIGRRSPAARHITR